MQRRLRALALAAVLATAGCGGPRMDEPPTVAVPPAWTQPGGPAGAPAPGADWWRAFGSPELEGLIAAALANNPDLAASAQRIAQATAQARAARAGLFPTLEGSASVSGSQRGEGDGTSSQSLSLDASYELDLWGRNRLAVDAAVASRIATEFDREAAALSLAAEVATTYFQLLSLNDRLVIAGQVLATAERLLELVETRAAAGATSGLEVAQQRGAVADLRAGIPALQQQRDQTLNALAALLGTTPGGLRLQATSLAGLQLPIVGAGLPSELLARRPDLRSADARLVAARADAAAARSALFPSVRLTGGAGLASDALEALFEPAGFFANVAAGLAQPIFDAGRLAAERDAAAARQAELVETYRAAVVAAFRDVENALAAVRYLARVEEAQRDAAAAAQTAYELAVVQYRAGAVDFQTALETQRSLIQQFDALYRTRFDRLTATVDLFRALGGGW